MSPKPVVLDAEAWERENDKSLVFAIFLLALTVIDHGHNGHREVDSHCIAVGKSQEGEQGEGVAGSPEPYIEKRKNKI